MTLRKRCSPVRVVLGAAVCFGIAFVHRSAFGQQNPAAPPVAVQPPPPPEFDPATEPAVRAVAQVLPAVVNIATERVVRQRVSDPFEDFFDQFFSDGGGRSTTPSRVLQQRIKSLGSGFLAGADGLIVTNEHVVERAGDMKIQVTFADGTALPARYVTGDRSKDLALIRVEPLRATANGKGGGPLSFPYLDLNRLSPNLLGQTVLVLGNPLGYNSSVARGILSAKDRDITVQEIPYKGLLQTDAAINPGNSGGPLIDLAGRLVGVSSVKASFTPQGTPTQGIGFAIPGKTVAAWVDANRATKGGAGARGSSAAATTASPPPGSGGGGEAEATAPAVAPLTNVGRLFGLSLRTVRRGTVVIAEVERESPAAEAGLRAGMVLLKIGTYPVTTLERVESVLADVPAGTAVDFVVGVPRTNGVIQQAETVTLLAREVPSA